MGRARHPGKPHLVVASEGRRRTHRTTPILDREPLGYQGRAVSVRAVSQPALSFGVARIAEFTEAVVLDYPTSLGAYPRDVVETSGRCSGDEEAVRCGVAQQAPARAWLPDGGGVGAAGVLHGVVAVHEPPRQLRADGAHQVVQPPVVAHGGTGGLHVDVVHAPGEGAGGEDERAPRDEGAEEVDRDEGGLGGFPGVLPTRPRIHTPAWRLGWSAVPVHRRF